MPNILTVKPTTTENALVSAALKIAGFVLSTIAGFQLSTEAGIGQQRVDEAVE